MVRKNRLPSIPRNKGGLCRVAAAEMNIPQLDITHQNAEIEITSHPAKIDISSQRPRLRLIRNDARMNIDRRMASMHIDRSNAEMMLGTGPVLEMNRQYLENAHQQVLDNIANFSADGTYAMHIENRGNALAEISAQAADAGTVSVNTSALPPANIDWEKGYLNIDWTPGSLDMAWDVSAQVDIHVEDNYVEIRLVKHPEVRIRVIYKNEAQAAGGQFVDQYL
jgi:hypothetical protein